MAGQIKLNQFGVFHFPMNALGDVNPCKTKNLTNMRASGKDDAVILTPVLPMTLEKAIQFIGDDEMVEVTPKSIRLRKTYLSAQERYRHRDRG